MKDIVLTLKSLTYALNGFIMAIKEILNRHKKLKESVIKCYKEK